ncbi:MAG: hypothetical protein PHE50_00015 [Dehalococcoidales bacterium]|nr:hypothetical protein [Dehalococcoidales bacterium]
MSEISDPLQTFKEDWVENPQFLTPFSTPIVFDDNVWGIVLYRKDEYQVQLFLVSPNTILPPHRHPNIDTIDVHLSGDIEFYVNGITLMCLSEHLKDHPHMPGISNCIGRTFRVRETDWHSAKIGEKGGSFLSFQRWLNGAIPTNVGDDWTAETNEKRRNMKADGN